MPARRIVAAALGAVVLAPLLPACAHQPPDTTPARVSSPLLGQEESAGSVPTLAGSSDGVAELAGLSVGDTMDVADLDEVVLTAAHDAGTFTATAGAPGLDRPAHLEFDIRQKRPRVLADLVIQGEDVRLVVVDGEAYVRHSVMDEPPWYHLDRALGDPVSRGFAPMIRAFSDLGSMSQDMVEADRGLTATVVDVAPTSVTFEVTVTAEQLRQMAKKGDLDGSLDGFTGEITKSIRLDRQGHPVAVDTTTAGVTQHVTYSEWGHAMEIVAPPPDMVGEMADVAGDSGPSTA